MILQVKNFFVVALLLLSAPALADIYLRPGQAEWINGERVYCMGQGGGGPQGQVERRAFRCANVDPLATLLDSELRATTTFFDGQTQVTTLFKFHFKNECDAVASDLNLRCGRGGTCNYHFCQANDPLSTLLNSTLYGVTSGWQGDIRVSPKESFNYMNECRSALSGYPR